MMMMIITALHPPQVQTLYVQTQIYNTLLRTRTDQNAVICQIRRWLSFCKSFVKKTEHFKLKPVEEDHEEEKKGLSGPQSLYKKSTILFVMMQDWVRDGEFFYGFLGPKHTLTYMSSR